MAEATTVALRGAEASSQPGSRRRDADEPPAVSFRRLAQSSNHEIIIQGVIGMCQMLSNPTPNAVQTSRCSMCSPAGSGGRANPNP
jgi:hypothetical protein